MALDTERIYRLLPAIHRLRDVENDGALRDLVSVIAEQAGVMEEDIAALYRNWFIETCDPWAVAYLADLLDVRGVNPVDGSRVLPQRAYVANTLAYRRRKGTLQVLEESVRDTTGWVTVAAEFFRDLSTTMNVNPRRAEAPGTADLRDAARLQLTDGAFDSGPRTAEMRLIADGGRANIQNIGLFVWRAEAYPLRQAEPRATAGGGPGRYFLDPLRRDLPLANTPEPERAIESLSREEHVPGLLRPLALYLELEARRQALADGIPAPTPVFFTAEPPFEIFLRANPGDPMLPVPPEEVMICHLGDLPADPTEWRRPPATVDYQPAGGGAPVQLPIAVGIDVARGRLAFPAGQVPAEVRVSHAVLSMGEIGGGPYGRRDSVLAGLDGRAVDWQAVVTRREAADGATVFASLAAAVAAWNALPAGQVGLIAVADSAALTETLTGAAGPAVPEGSRLVIAAADWPATPVPGGPSGMTARQVGLFDASGVRPALVGDLEVNGTAPAGSLTPGALVLDGLLLAGQVTVATAAGEGLGLLRLAHVTQDPAAGGIDIGAGNEQLVLDLTRARTGPVTAADDIQRLAVTESVLSGGGGAAITLAAGAVSLNRATVLGGMDVERIDASNSLLAGPATARRLQVGCVRFSFVESGSTLPRRYRCQPDLALEGAAPADAARIRARIVPGFASLEPAHHAYALLGPLTPPEIAEGAEDGAAMGAWGILMQPQRRANAAGALDEYLRFGLEAGLIEVT